MARHKLKSAKRGRETREEIGNETQLIRIACVTRSGRTYVTRAKKQKTRSRGQSLEKKHGKHKEQLENDNKGQKKITSKLQGR